jgi:hypothetical protein
MCGASNAWRRQFAHFSSVITRIMDQKVQLLKPLKLTLKWVVDHVEQNQLSLIYCMYSWHHQHCTMYSTSFLILYITAVPCLLCCSTNTQWNYPWAQLTLKNLSRWEDEKFLIKKMLFLTRDILISCNCVGTSQFSPLDFWFQIVLFSNQFYIQSSTILFWLIV